MMMPLLDNPTYITYIVTGAITFGTALGAFRVAQNGINKTLKRHDGKLDDIHGEQVSQGNRLTVVETCLKLLYPTKVDSD